MEITYGEVRRRKMRLIDADKLNDVIQRLNDKGWGITRKEYKLIDRVLFEFPTVDIIRCKDCKYWAEDKHICGEENGMLICDPDDFCSGGERKDG